MLEENQDFSDSTKRSVVLKVFLQHLAAQALTQGSQFSDDIKENVPGYNDDKWSHLTFVFVVHVGTSSILTKYFP